MEIVPIEAGSITSAKDFMAAGITAGLKSSGALDMALIYSRRPCTVAAAFTSNLFAAAPVTHGRAILAQGQPVQAVLINSGNANACTGEQGMCDAHATAASVAKLLQLPENQVLVSSTGRIGVPLPMDIICSGAARAVAALSDDGGTTAATAIMTTDTRPKSVAVELELDGRRVVIGGMAKGAGMIAPKMRLQPPQATMLAYLTTDAAVSRQALQVALGNGLEESFNRITVDGDTSTNDTVIALANGSAGNDTLEVTSPGFAAFQNALSSVLGQLARAIVLDGEGATRFVEVSVKGAKSEADARCCAEAIANSALCKTAWFGGDPNWGRILCAAGYSGINFAPEQVSLVMQGVTVVSRGLPTAVSEEQLAPLVQAKELQLELDLGAGTGDFTVWTCDLTYDYVKINADYRT